MLKSYGCPFIMNGGDVIVPLESGMTSDHSVRRMLEEKEYALSPFAIASSSSRGRDRGEDSSLVRTEFQRDRDRILHTKAFRRLKHKTQVFICPTGDHYVTRLTHTLEVSQIGRTIARALNLNEDLVEAMTLGHDLGHTPFGHVGEQVFDNLYPGGFRHSEQSLRVVEVLEKNGQGLNLTWEVRQGILLHSKPRGDFLSDNDAQGLTLEAQICRLADAIAYINHDVDDAIRAGLLTDEDIPAAVKRVLGGRHSQRVDTMVRDVIDDSWACTGEFPIRVGETPIISMSAEIGGAMIELREFLFNKIYIPSSQGEEARVAREILQILYYHFGANPDVVPVEYHVRGESAERMALDYISGMTDNYALRISQDIMPGIAGDFFRWHV
jgi:dGTPase